MEVRKGYKQTEAGLIPDDWHEYTVGDLIDFEGGSQPVKWMFSPILKPGFIRLIQIRDYKTDKYATYAPQNLVRRFCTENDIMIGRYGPPIFQILRGIAGAYNVALLKAIPHSNINHNYAYYFLKQEKLFTFVEKLSQRSSGQTGVDLKELKGYPLPLPPTLAEQEAIAEALSDADAFIEALEQLLTKKRQIKQGAMQELLAGKRRLPEFVRQPGYKQTEVGVIPEDWDTPRIDEVCKLINGRGFKPFEWKTTGLPIIRIQNLNGSDEFNYFDGSYDKKLEVYNEQLLFAWSGSRGTSFGPHIWHGSLGVLNYHTWKVQINDTVVSKKFFLHALRQLTWFIEGKAHGAAALVHVQKWEMESFRFPFPPSIPEQTAIAEILSDMDAEITALERKLSKARQVKQGMMSVLLTGKIRLNHD